MAYYMSGCDLLRELPTQGHIQALAGRPIVSTRYEYGQRGHKHSASLATAVQGSKRLEGSGAHPGAFYGERNNVEVPGVARVLVY